MRPMKFIFLLLLILAPLAGAQEIKAGPGEVTLKLGLEGESFSKAVNVFLMLTLLSLAPGIIILMTSFTRIVIVLSFFRQALGAQQIPSGRIINGLALFLTLFIMQPTWQRISDEAIKPYTDKQITQQQAIDRAIVPVKDFMLNQMLKGEREDELLLFMDLAKHPEVEDPHELPMRIIIPAFILSELKIAFQMGFLVFLPFLVIDMVVSTVLMSLGMMMLPPAMVSLPMKLLLFILVDGWTLLVSGIVNSFN